MLILDPSHQLTECTIKLYISDLENTLTRSIVKLLDQVYRDATCFSSRRTRLGPTSAAEIWTRLMTHLLHHLHLSVLSQRNVYL